MPGYSRARKRKKPHLKPDPGILIVCEDSKSSLNYFLDAQSYYRISKSLKITHCGKTDPDGIVKYAVENKNKFKEVYCVIDRDTHNNFDAAVNRAQGNHVKLIVSYPSFEFWLILHFKYSRSSYVQKGGKSPGECAEKDLKAVDALMENYTKGDHVDYFQLLEGRLDTAISRAKRTVVEANQTGDNNPSTYIHQLIARMKQLSI